MRIDRLRIENFRRLREVDLEIGDGVTALVGRNGAGKSTFLESIGWCLFGNEAARTGKDLIKRRGAGPGEDVRVHLAFSFGGHAYEVTRELLGKSEAHVASVKVDGRLVVNPGAASSKECTAYVTRLFHMDRDAFFTSLVARQRELAALTDAPPSHRKKVLIGLLRLDAVDTAIADARVQKRDAKSRLAGLRSATSELAPLRDRVQQTRALLESDARRLAECESGIAALVDEVEDVRGRREQSRKRADEHRHALTRVSMAQERVQHLQRERARRGVELQRARQAATEAVAMGPRLQTLPDARERLERLQALAVRHQEIQRTRIEIQRADEEAARAQADVESARGQLASAGAIRGLAERIVREKPRHEALLQEWQQQAAELAARAQEAARQLNEAVAKEKRVRDMGPESPCPTCTRPLREHQAELLHGFADEIARLRTLLAELTPRLEEARRQEAAARKSVQELAERDQELRGKLARLEREEERLAGATARLADATDRAARLRDQEKALGAEAFDPKLLESVRGLVRELEALRERHARLAAEADREVDIQRILAEVDENEKLALSARQTAEAERDALGFDPAQHEALEKVAQAVEARLSEARILRERILGERGRRADEEKRLVAEIARQEDLQRQAVELESHVVLLEQLAGDRDVGLLPEFKDHLVSRVRPLLSLHAGRLFQQLTEGRYADLEVDEDYDLKVHEDGEAFALERFSGGEGDLANLCLRLAVSQVVAERAGTEGFGFLALDEVFGSQDHVRKGNILHALKGLSGRFRQILLITHIDDVKDSAERVIRVEALDDGTSRVTVES